MVLDRAFAVALYDTVIPKGNVIAAPEVVIVVCIADLFDLDNSLWCQWRSVRDASLLQTLPCERHQDALMD
jgi:hypothetical protein